jgi:penicillin-binding protein 2
VFTLGQREVSPGLRRRLTYAFGVACLGFLFLLGKLWDLQVLRGDEAFESSKRNRIRLHRVQATRGRVLDRHGRVLIDSRPSFNAILVPEDTGDVELTIENLSHFLNQSAAEVHALLEKAATRSPFAEIVVKRDLSWEEVVALETHQLDLPGVTVQITPRRSYPHGSELGHILGYVGEVSPQELEADRHYRMGDLVGKAGLEKYLEPTLRGIHGGQQVEVDSVGRRLRVLREVPEVPGDTVRLTIDLDLQRAASKALGERDGSVVAIDLRSGGVLAFANHPSFDPNVFARGISNEEWGTLASDPHHPLTNRGLQGQYPPGSAFKIVVAAAAVEEGIINPFTRLYCPGGLQFGNHYFRCWERGGHGSVNLLQALERSCDVFFYQVAQRLGVDTIARYARLFGLGQKSGVSFGHEKAGTIPDQAWKRARFNEPWYAGETLSVAIGQGYVTSTPLQMVNMIGALATGKRMRPHFVLQVENANGEVAVGEQIEEVASLPLRETTLNQIRDGLHAVVHGSHGTGARARLPGISVAGKTLTSQVVKLRKHRTSEIPRQYRDHAGFVAYAPTEAPEIAIAVVVEHAEAGGGRIAAPVAHDVLEEYFRLKEERLDPTYAEVRPTADRPL